MLRNSQKKKISGAICDRDLVSMELEQSLEMYGNFQEKKRGKVISDRDFDLMERALRGEMYHNSQEKTRNRSRSRERNSIGGLDHDVIERGQIQGNVQVGMQSNMSKMTLDFPPGIRASVEGSSCNLKSKRASSKKASRTTIKALIDNEISNEKEIRRSSPSLLARLMGLDPLPPVVSKQRKERGISSQKTSSDGPHGKLTAHEGYPHCMCNSKYEECKDVYEVMEMPMVQKQNDKPFQKGTSRLEQGEGAFKLSNTNLAFSKQQFMDAAHLSADDEFHYFEENNDTLEAPDPSEDIFAKFLQEPNSLFKKHLQDLKCSPPSPPASCITILKPSKFARSGNEICFNSGKNAEYGSSLLKEDISFARKPGCNLGHSVKECSHSLPCKVSEPSYAGKTKVHHQPTQIVVLKPSLENGWDTRTALPMTRSPENYHYDLKRQKRIPRSRRSKVYAGRRDRHKLPENVEMMGHKEKGLREIARDITKQLRTAKSSSSEMEATIKMYACRGNETLHGMPGIENCDNLSTSSYYSTESSVRKEARKRLSQRWKMIHHVLGEGPVDEGSSTLGEMLVYDRDTPRNTLNSSIIHNLSGEKVAGGETLAKWDCPLGIRSKEGWKEGWSRNLLGSESLPDSLLFFGNRQPSKRNRAGFVDSSYFWTVSNKSPNNSLVRNVSQRRSSIQSSKDFSGRDEKEMSEWEICVNSEESQCRVHQRHLTEAVCMVPELLNDSVVGRSHEGGNIGSQCKDVNFPLTIDDPQVQHSTKMEMPVNNGGFSTADLRYVEKKETLVTHPQANSVSSHCEMSESPSPVSSKDDQPSPVSVLELPPLEEDLPGSDCFKKISADLKELRMQLRLLKSESADTDDEDLDLIISRDGYIEGEHRSTRNSVPILRAFRDDEDRDFLYLLDVPIDSSIQPVGKEVFEKLEKKYNVVSSWSRSDRMLLFDLITSLAADIVTAKSKRPCPTFAHETLVEEAWLLVTKQGEELSRNMEVKVILEQKWLDLGDDVDIIGKELERMLFDDLIEEFADFR